MTDQPTFGKKCVFPGEQPCANCSYPVLRNTSGVWVHRDGLSQVDDGPPQCWTINFNPSFATPAKALPAAVSA